MAEPLKVLVPIADGSEEIETSCITDTLVRAGAAVTVASAMGEASSTEGKFALFLFHSFDLGSILVLFPFALSTRPTGIFFFLLFKVLVIYTVAIVELQVPADDAAAQALSLLIMNPAKNDAKLAALSLKALVIRVASVLAAWLITAHQVYWKDELAHHFLQPGNACILIMAAVSLIGLVCCARYWAKRGFWAAATSALPSSAPAEQGKSAPTAKDDRLPQEDPLPQDPLLSPA